MDEGAKKNQGARVGYGNVPGGNAPLRNFEKAPKFPQTGKILEQTFWGIIDTEGPRPPSASGDVPRQGGCPTGRSARPNHLTPGRHEPRNTPVNELRKAFVNEAI